MISILTVHKHIRVLRRNCENRYLLFCSFDYGIVISGPVTVSQNSLDGDYNNVHI